MVLTNRQRRELHIGIYEYLLSQGPAFEDAAIALSEADPSCIREPMNGSTIDENNSTATMGTMGTGGTFSDDKSVTSVSSRYSTASTSSKFSTGGLSVGSTTTSSSSSSTRSKIAHLPVLERKWTAVPRLQKKIFELEKMLRTIRSTGGAGIGIGPGIGIGSGTISNGTNGSAKGIVVTNGLGMNGGTGSERRMLPRPPCNYELKGHAGVISCVAVHPTFTVAVSGSEDGMIKIWDHESGEYIRTLKGHTNTIHSLAFAPSGSHLVSTSSDLSIKLWDFTTYTCVRTLKGHDHTISDAKFLPSPVTSSLFNSSSTTNGHNSNDSSNGYSNHNVDGTGIDTNQTGSSILISASRDKTVKFWDLETGYCQHTLTDHNDWVRCVAIRDYDGNVMATAGNDTSIYVYNVVQDGSDESFGSQKCIRIATLLGHEHAIESIAFVTSATSSTASSSSPTSSSSSPSPTSSMTPTSSSTSSSPTSKSKSSLSSDGKKTTSFIKTNTKSSKQKHIEKINNYLASGSRDRTVKLWNIKTQSCISSFAYHGNWVRSVLLHPSGKYVISAGDDRTIRVMDITSNRCLRTITDAHPHFVTCIAMHYSLPILVSGGVDMKVRCWQLD